MNCFNLKTKIVGILNVTPDSFSDGNLYFNSSRALMRAAELVEQGADIIELGGLSSRPGSSGITWEEEWQRIEPVVRGLRGEIKFSVDTYSIEVAQRALDLGAGIINDISGGSKLLLEKVVSYGAQVVLMHSVYDKIHDFTQQVRTPDINQIVDYLLQRKLEAVACGLNEQSIILDPGMGAFLGQNPNSSWAVLNQFNRLQALSTPIMLAISRKGFLKISSEQSPADRDLVSAIVASEIVGRWGQCDLPVYIRTHNPLLQMTYLK